MEKNAYVLCLEMIQQKMAIRIGESMALLKEDAHLRTRA